MHIIETHGLTHRFGAAPVLRGIDLAVPRGSIFGFLGPNGAGKTTTLRLILGLLRRQTGTILLFGKPLDGHRRDILRRVGSLIESPSVYGHLTATENLEVWRRSFGCAANRIPIVLDMVGLGTTSTKVAGRFSLGMKQRLGIAAALLHQPELLVLDEPANGLDPQGILEMRRLLETLNRELAVTVLVSSHILSEVERLVTHTAVIHQGALRFQGTLDNLLQQQEAASVTSIETSDGRRAVAIAQGLGLSGGLENGRVVVTTASREAIARLTAALVASGLDVYQVASKRPDLERIFLDLVGG